MLPGMMAKEDFAAVIEVRDLVIKRLFGIIRAGLISSPEFLKEKSFPGGAQRERAFDRRWSQEGSLRRN